MRTRADIFIVVSIILIMGCRDTDLDGFSQSPYFDEQVLTYRFEDMVTIHINAPSPADFDPAKQVGIVLFALPNGNTIEFTAGKITDEEDDWHYDIQHIAAQTRYLRQHMVGYNLVTVYLEADGLSWPAWKAAHSDYREIVQRIVAEITTRFERYDPFLVLTGHSGGGRFIFSYLDGHEQIPDQVKRICFLDSNYGYEHHYGDQFIAWLDRSRDHKLIVLAYNDSIALYQGKTFVSATGGTWYRSRIMQKYLAEHYDFSSEADSSFIRHEALDGRLQITLKKNPNRGIYHTEQVELNGFIHTMVSGTAQEGVGYQYFGDRVYGDLIQPEELPRSKNSS